MANIRTEPSKPTPSSSDEDAAIVELLPPADCGFSGTAKLYAVADAPMIAELIKRGYTKVEKVRV